MNIFKSLSQVCPWSWSCASKYTMNEISLKLCDRRTPILIVSDHLHPVFHYTG